ncbi:MAG TPA: ubiquinol-cytochrome c reductase iron-sulfur subunit [Rhizomicrobium sp.]|nr:ubiquinol-cytochrome c reductase iron-sulfur subunit [Rhizomicrobium sp.]
MPAEDIAATQPAEPEVRRRDFILVATTAAGIVGGLFALWPLIDQMEPSADVIAAGGPVTVNVSKIPPGQQVEVLWRSRPIFVVHRTPPILERLRSASLLAMLSDPNSDQLQQPPYAQNWSRSIRPEYLVLVGICTHLGCIPHLMAKPGALSPSWPGGYLCPCHGSKYDLAGRVFKGVPAPLNLPVPPYNFAGPTTLVIGENPKGYDFDLGSVKQL